MVMSVKGLKQKVAAALIVAMTASNVLSAAAATGGIGTPSEKEVVAVTFKAGEGAGWTNIATWAKATRNDAETATKSDAVRSADEITREFVITEDDELIGTDNNKNARYINLERAGEWFKDAEWNDVDRLQNDGLKFANWYYDGGTDIGKVPVVSTTEIFNGAVLEAGWYKPANGKSEQIDVESVKAVGLPVNAKVTVRDLQDDEKETTESLNKILKAEGLEITGADAVVGIDIDVDVENLTDDVTISLTAPDRLGEVKEGDGNIKAIHIRSGKSPVVYPVSVVKDGDEFHLAFTVKKEDGFSPFYFVKTAETDEVKDVKVTIESVENGYVAAWTQTKTEDGKFHRKYLPIGEEVTLKSTDQLLLHASEYSLNETGWHGRLESLSKITVNADGEEVITPIREGVLRPLDEDCKIRAKFRRVDNGEPIDDYGFQISVDPDRILEVSEEPYSGNVTVEKYNQNAGEWTELLPGEYSLRPLTLEELEELAGPGVNLEDYAEALSVLKYDAAANTLTSEKPLEMGTYEYPFAITYRDEAESLYSFKGIEWTELYTVSITVGATIRYMHGFVKVNGVYGAYNDEGAWPIGEKEISYNEGTTFGDIDTSLDDLYYDEPEMYGYVFAGWQDYKGNRYHDESSLVRYQRSSRFNVYDVFVKEGTDEVYDAPAAEGNGIDQVDLTKWDQGNSGEDKGNQDGDNGGNNDNQGGGSTSGRSSGSSGGGSASAARDYTMHGNWIATENGWRFLKDSGEYAANTWGYINGLWYFFDEQGNMVTGWRYVNGQWYYMNPAAGSVQGAMMTGWVLDPTYNAWFYLTGSGAMATGWQQINGLWYYLNPVSDGTRGVMAANTYVDGYFVNADGVWVQ